MRTPGSVRRAAKAPSEIIGERVGLQDPHGRIREGRGQAKPTRTRETECKYLQFQRKFPNLG